MTRAGDAVHLLAVGSRTLAVCGLRLRSGLRLTGSVRCATCPRCVSLMALRPHPSARARFRARLLALPR